MTYLTNELFFYILLGLLALVVGIYIGINRELNPFFFSRIVKFAYLVRVPIKYPDTSVTVHEERIVYARNDTKALRIVEAAVTEELKEQGLHLREIRRGHTEVQKLSRIKRV